MTSGDELTRLTEVLRSPAHASELADSTSVVAQMTSAAGSAAAATAAATLTPATPGALSMLKLVLANKAAAVLGSLVLGTATAAAATGNLPVVQETNEDVPAEVTESEVEEIEIEVEDVGEETEADEFEDEIEPITDENGDPYGDVECDDAGNHGEYVSSVAQDESIEGNRGAIVSQAARTDCGKDKEDKEDKKAEQEEKKQERADRKGDDDDSEDEDEESDLEDFDDDDDDPDEDSDDDDVNADDDSKGKSNGKAKGPKGK